MIYRRIVVTAALLALSVAGAQEQKKIASPEVHQDGSITVRYQNAGAKKVVLNFPGIKGLEMQKDSAGVWSATVPPQKPETYGYSLNVDGVSQIDPLNGQVTPNLVFLSSLVTIPGTPAMPWDLTAVPHGEVHHHIYTTKAAEGKPENQSDYYVYTPAGYDARAKADYPVLYLLHGWSDTTAGWVEMGYANRILDNLIATGKAKPMIVVMPSGYGQMSFVTDWSAWNSDERIGGNVDHFEQAMLTEVIPLVEKEYRVRRDAGDRAIAGLSMGGLESLTVGLEHPELFGWVGAFSSAIHRTASQQRIEAAATKANHRQLLWVACGTSDSLIESNRTLVTWLKANKVPVTAVETEGAHTWQVWHQNLLALAPLLFQK